MLLRHIRSLVRARRLHNNFKTETFIKRIEFWFPCNRQVFPFVWIESQMIIDFRLHTSDNALTENGVRIAVYSASCSISSQFSRLTFNINAPRCKKTSPDNVWKFLWKLRKHFDATLIDNDATWWNSFKLHSFVMTFPELLPQTANEQARECAEFFLKKIKKNLSSTMPSKRRAFSTSLYNFLIRFFPVPFIFPFSPINPPRLAKIWSWKFV